MTGDQLKRLRKDQGWSQDRLNTVLQEALSHRYGSSAISRWERGTADIPSEVDTFLSSLILGAGSGGAGEDADQDAPAGGSDDETLPPSMDSPPPLPPGQETLTSVTGGALERACVELWELIGTTVTLSGSVLGSQAVTTDGQIIASDARALGRAYGKLAETNETFRTMLVGMTQGGAWLEVAMVTGTTAAKIVQNHYAHQVTEVGGENGHADGQPDLSQVFG